MLIEYHNDVFNATIQGDKVNIWKYVPADGLKKAQTRRGIAYYERYVLKDEISRPFSVSFFAVKGNRKYAITSVIDRKMTIMCDDQEFAATMGFQETERGVWVKSVDISSFESFVMIKYVQNSSDRIVQNLDRTEMIAYWKKYVKDVSISRLSEGE